MTTQSPSPAGIAIRSERLLFPTTDELVEPPGPGRSTGKTLLTRPTRDPWPTGTRRRPPREPRPANVLKLVPLNWDRYEPARIEVEAGFGVAPPQARAMIAELRERCERLGLTMLSMISMEDALGAFGFFVPVPGWARLQEIDVFPAWRGQGLGDALMAAALTHLDGLGVSTVIVGADEDDWPLSWYRRRGFVPVARVPLGRHQ